MLLLLSAWLVDSLSLRLLCPSCCLLHCTGLLFRTNLGSGSGKTDFSKTVAHGRGGGTR